MFKKYHLIHKIHNLIPLKNYLMKKFKIYNLMELYVLIKPEMVELEYVLLEKALLVYHLL